MSVDTELLGRDRVDKEGEGRAGREIRKGKVKKEDRSVSREQGKKERGGEQRKSGEQKDKTTRQKLMGGKSLFKSKRGQDESESGDTFFLKRSRRIMILLWILGIAFAVFAGLILIVIVVVVFGSIIFKIITWLADFFGVW